MPPPKSPKLQRDEAAEAAPRPVAAAPRSVISPPAPPQEGPVQVREVECCNDYVAILQTQINTTIDLAGSDAKYKSEGLIIGVGPGISDGAGGRLKPCVGMGDYVAFGEKQVARRIESKSPPYDGRIVLIVPERAILCKLPHKIETVQYEGE